MTDWQTWTAEHPDSTVVLMSRTSDKYVRQSYRQPDRFVLGIADGDEAKAWGFDRLHRSPALNDLWDGKPVLVAFDPTSVTARMYDGNLDNQKLTFRMANGKLVDDQTGSTWELTTGRAVAGTLAGKHLKPLPAIVSYKKVWLTFHPKSDLTAGQSP